MLSWTVKSEKITIMLKIKKISKTFLSLIGNCYYSMCGSNFYETDVTYSRVPNRRLFRMKL